MRSKLAALCLALVIAATGCATNGDDVGTEADPTERARPEVTPGADASPGDGDGDGGDEQTDDVNRPREGTYVYDYASESTNASTPTASPRRAAEEAELTSKVSHDGDVITTEEKSSEGPAVATSRWRWSDDGAVELSFETKTQQATSGCRFEKPIEMLRIPIKAEKFEKQSFDGTGTSCNGERTVTVERMEDVEDEEGKTWPTWRMVIETSVRGQGLTNRSTVVRWFSPELGKDIKIETTSELVNASGSVSARGESTSVLKAYPS